MQDLHDQGSYITFAWTTYTVLCLYFNNLPCTVTVEFIITASAYKQMELRCFKINSTHGLLTFYQLYTLFPTVITLGTYWKIMDRMWEKLFSNYQNMTDNVQMSKCHEPSNFTLTRFQEAARLHAPHEKEWKRCLTVFVSRSIVYSHMPDIHLSNTSIIWMPPYTDNEASCISIQSIIECPWNYHVCLAWFVLLNSVYIQYN